MQLCRKNNIIIINVAKHKRTIEEKHANIKTRSETRGKPTMEKTLAFFSSYRLSSNDSAKESTIIHIFKTTRTSMK